MNVESIIAGAVAFSNHARIVCPCCSGERRKKNVRCMTVDRKEDGSIVYCCHHCGTPEMNGIIPTTNGSNYGRTSRMDSQQQAAPVKASHPDPFPSASTSIAPKLQPLDVAYLQSRGLSEATCLAAGLYSTKKFFSTPRSELPCIAFPYRDSNNVMLGNKYRTDSKHFTQDAGGVHAFYGLDCITDPDKHPIVITEGEIDKLSFDEAGVPNALSVPSGAPMLVRDGKADPREDKRFACVWNAKDILDKATKIILAVDNDVPGKALEEELARRIGKHRCWTVTYPAGCKDANDVLTKHGAEALRLAIASATPYPIAGLFTADHYELDVETLYQKRTGKGLSTGLPSVDPLYTVAPGQLTIVTGLPSHGKSNFIDQLTVSLADRCMWKTAYCSFENPPNIHIARLMEIITGKPFFDDGKGTPRITDKERKDAMDIIKQHFAFIDFRDTEPPTIDAILMRAGAAVQRMGIRGLVIDPYNYVRLERRGSETDEISDMISKVQAFNKANDVHTWFIAHPTKMYDSEGNRPNGMNVHGSMSWWAKADCGLTLHRGRGTEVIVDVWKCRYRWVGKQGTARLHYNMTAGTYEDSTYVVSQDVDTQGNPF